MTVCSRCSLLSYQTKRKGATFAPPFKNLIEFLSESDLLPAGDSLQSSDFCLCLDDDSSLRKEFQNKCMVVNQDSSSDLRSPKVQCVIVNRDLDKDDKIHVNGEAKNRKNAENGDVNKKVDKFITDIGGKNGRISKQLRGCEYCGVEEAQMSGCRQCGKVRSEKKTPKFIFYNLCIYFQGVVLFPAVPTGRC